MRAAPLMDLRGPVPNCGAHRVAWVIGTAPDPRLKFAELQVALGPNMVERLLAGDWTPGASMGGRIFVWSNGRITAKDFYRKTPKRWGEAPYGFGAPKRAAMPARPVPPASEIVEQGASFRRLFGLAAKAGA